MTVTSTIRTAGPYAGNGSTVSFPFNFKVFQASDVLVKQINTATQTEATLNLSSDYTVALNANQNTSPGGIVTLSTALASGYTLEITSNIPITQGLSIPNPSGFYPQAIEDAFDRLTIILQQLGGVGSGQTIRVPETAGVAALPNAAGRANTQLLFDSQGNPYVTAPVSGSAADVLLQLANLTDPTKGDALLGVQTSVAGSVATTQHQVNEERTSVFRFMTAAQITAISAETGASSAVCATALQAGLDGSALNTLPHGTYQIDVPLRIKSGTPRVTLKGDNRIRCILQPNAVSIATAPVNVNALFINQDNNPHFCMENMRMTATNGYTGIGIYCVENGGGDGSGQCMFSGIFRNLWVDFGSTNAGFLAGATQNTTFDTMTFENMKGIFNLQGVGNGDNFYKSVSMYNCYDQFILQTTDTNGAFAMSVDGLHAYSHQRGRLFDVQNWNGGNINDVILEPATGNLGSTGLFRFTNSTGLLVSNFYALSRTGVPACATAIEINGSTGKFINGAINADIGLLFSGGAVDVEFVNVDFTSCTTACLQILANITGTIRTRGCKFNNATVYGFVNQVGSSNDWYSYDDEFINAGLGGNAGSRNISLTTSGTVVLVRPRIGRNNGSAAAAYFVDASGSGTVDIYDPIWVGTPPTARFTGSQTVNVHISQPTSLSTQTSATYTVLPSDGYLVANFAGTITYTLPSPSSGLGAGRRLKIRTVQNQAVVSASSNVVPITGGSPGTAILPATAGKWAELVSDGVNWQVVASN
jgi:hypothetical protein